MFISWWNGLTKGKRGYRWAHEDDLQAARVRTMANSILVLSRSIALLQYKSKTFGACRNMVQIPVRQIALEEFLDLPDTKPASEYIDGEIIQKPMPQGQHSIIQKKLLFAIDPILSAGGIAQAFPELRCTFGGRSIVPDVVVFEEAKIPYDENGEIENIFNIPPDWTIEILSPDQSTTKVLKNINHCLAYGTQMGWLIDPKERAVFVMGIDRTFQIIDELSTLLPVPTFAKSIELTVLQLFNWVKKTAKPE
jgi:Uma2 family endonuclease